jgi:hypothetical protein
VKTDSKKVALHCGVHTLVSSIPCILIVWPKSTVWTSSGILLGLITFWLLACWFHLGMIYERMQTSISVTLNFLKKVRFLQALVIGLVWWGRVWQVPQGYFQRFGALLSMTDFLAGLMGALGVSVFLRTSLSDSGELIGAAWFFKCYLVTVVVGVILFGSMVLLAHLLSWCNILKYIPSRKS